MNHIIKKQNVRVAGAVSAPTGEKHVELLEEGGVVRAVEVRCSCGEATVVELEYEDARALAPDPR